jgi:hypothetical protein
MPGRRDVVRENGAPAVPRLNSGVVSRVGAAEERSDEPDAADRVTRAEAPTMPPPPPESAELDPGVPAEPQRPMSGFFSVKETVVADLKRDPRSEK